MWITMTGVLVAFAGGIMIWFRIPFSPVKRRFRKDISMLLSENQGLTESGIFTKEDFSRSHSQIRGALRLYRNAENVLSENEIS